MQRFQWRVLPQGTANSLTLCQKFVSQAISPIRSRFPDAYIIHYMDDILPAHPEENQLNLIFDALQLSLTASGLYLAPEKVQKRNPYLTWNILLNILR
jgi:hypothetical protein